VKLWDAMSAQERVVLKGHTGWVSSLAFSPDGKRLVSGTGGSSPQESGELNCGMWQAVRKSSR